METNCMLLMAPQFSEKTRLGFRLPTLRMSAVCGCIGHASHFLVALDSVVDNLLPAALPFLLSIYPNREEADKAWEWIVSMRIYGLALGSVLAVIISTYCGRRRPLIVGMTMQFIGAVLSSLVRYAYGGVFVAFFGRFLNGLGSGIVQVIGSSMMAEVPAARHRGTVLATYTMWACAGEFFGLFISMDFALGNEKFWPLALAVPTSILPFCIVCVWNSAESPRHLVSKNKLEEAKRSLQYYQVTEDWETSLNDMTSEVRLYADQFKCEPTWLGPIKRQLMRFKDGSFIRPLFVATFTQSFVHMNDWLWISYSTQVFINAGLPSAAAQTASLLMAIPQAFVSFGLLFCFDNFSRRYLLITPTIGSILCGILGGTALRKRKGQFLPLLPNQYILPVVATVDLCLAAVASESAYTITPELFLQTDRVIGTAIVTFVQNIFGGILSNLLLTVINEKGTEYVLIPFAIINVFYVLGVAQILPETSHKTFQEIAKSFSRDLPGARLLRKIRRILGKVVESRNVLPTIFYKVNSVQGLLVIIAQTLLFLFFVHKTFQSIAAVYYG